MQPGRHLGDVVIPLGLDRIEPVGRRGRPAAAHRVQKRGHAGADIADHGCGDLDIGIHFLRLDVDLDELLRRIAPGLALAVRQQPVEAGADQHHHVGIFQDRRARGTGALRMEIGQQAFGHAHRQKRDTALFDEGTDGVVGLGVGGALAEDDQRTLGALEHVERAVDGRGRGYLRGRGIDHLDQRLASGFRIHHLPEQFRRQVEIDAARPARHRGADRAGKTDADVGGVQHAEGRLAERLRDRELIHFLIVALLQVDDLALRRAGDQDHREAVRGGVGQCGQAVQEAGRRHREAYARFLGEEAGDRRGITGVLFVAERQHADAFGLRHAAEVGDRNARARRRSC